MAVQVDQQGQFLRFSTMSEGDPVRKNDNGYVVSVPFPDGFRMFVTDEKAFKFDIDAYQALDKPIASECKNLWKENFTEAEIDELMKPQSVETSEMDRIGEQLVQRELEALELKQQNEILGQQIVLRELESADLKAQNEDLGAQIVGLELRVLSMETQAKGEETNV